MKIARFLLLLIVFSETSYSQIFEGNRREVSFSGGYQDFTSGSGSNSSGLILLSPRIGVFVFKGLELEPEVILMLSSGSSPVYVANGNVSYNFASTRKEIPFVLIGYGVANAVPIFNLPVSNIGYRVDVFNAGAGLKFRASDDIIFRFEFRYQRFSGTDRTHFYTDYAYNSNTNITVRSVQFGFGFFL